MHLATPLLTETYIHARIQAWKIPTTHPLSRILYDIKSWVWGSVKRPFLMNWFSSYKIKYYFCESEINCIKLFSLYIVFFKTSYLERTLQRRHNGCDNVSNHQPHHCLLNRLFRRRSEKTSKLRVTGLCAGIHRRPVNSPHKWPVTRKKFPFDDVIMIFKYSSEI